MELSREEEEEEVAPAAEAADVPATMPAVEVAPDADATRRPRATPPPAARRERLPPPPPRF